MGRSSWAAWCGGRSWDSGDRHYGGRTYGTSGERHAYQGLLERISQTYDAGRSRALSAVNRELIETYWQVGRHIVEFEQGGEERAEYGAALLDTLSNDLTLRHGKGFSRSNLSRIRQFYLTYPKGATLSHELSWSHIIELLKIDDPLERGFYEKQTALERWSRPRVEAPKRKLALSCDSPPAATRQA